VQQSNFEKSVWNKTNRTNARGEGEARPQQAAAAAAAGRCAHCPGPARTPQQARLVSAARPRPTLLPFLPPPDSRDRDV
jgi:hypothetical protein